MPDLVFSRLHFTNHYNGEHCVLKALGGACFSILKFSCIQSLVWPFTQEAQPGTGEISCGGDKTEGKQTVRFFPIYRHITVILTDMINVSI